MLMQNCAINDIQTYQPSAEKPWNKERIAHLYRRLGFGATYNEIIAGLATDPEDLVDQLIDGAFNLPNPATPFWGDYTMQDFEDNPDLEVFQLKMEFRRRWLLEMTAEGPVAIRAKLALFWSNHFVTAENVYECINYMWKYYELLNTHCLGNFKEFVELMGINPAMLVYLNGNLNVVNEPNENYARELMELFTMGENNGYTQNDIAEVSRALTGWQAHGYFCIPVSLDENLYDNGSKTIFGQTGNWDYGQVHDLIFEQRTDEVAHHICSEIYKFFVYPEINEDIVNALAETFKAPANNWNLVPVFKQLFKSEHFFDEVLITGHIKSHVEVFIGTIKLIGLEHNTHYTDDLLDFFTYRLDSLGQHLFNPPDVAGWPGHRAWVNENTLTSRWNFSGQQLYWYLDDPGRAQMVQLALDLSNGSNNPEIIVGLVANHFLGKDLSPAALQTAIQYFKGDVPENYFQDGSWSLYWDSAPWQMLTLINHLVRLPEFHLV